MSFIAASLTLDDGRIVRFGGDESSPENVPYDVSWDTTIPGGFGVGSLTVPRPENLYADDAKLFADVTIYGPGAQTLYEGYVTGVPQVGAGEIELQLSGWSTVLDRIQTFREIFVDRDLSRWESASGQRRLNLAAFFPFGSPELLTDDKTSLPAVKLGLPITTSITPIAEAWYDAGPGCFVASVYYEMTSVSVAADGGAWRTATTDANDNEVVETDLLTGTNSASTGTMTPTPGARRYVYFTFFNNTGTALTTEKSVTLKNLAVYGNHGLTKRGSAPQGFYGSDIIDYIVRQSPLNTTLGDSIEPSTFVIPHLAFYEDTSLTEAIEQVTALGGSQNVPNDWGVYDDRTFFWKSPGSYGRTWHVRRDEVATSSSEGPDADRRVSGVKVLYQDGAGANGAGATLSVGPPGTRSDYETTDLLDSDPENPAYRIPGAYAVESVGITSQQGAINIGTMILNKRNRLQWRGTINLQGEVTDSSGNTYPVSAVRAGDQIVVSDDADTAPRPVNQTSYDHAGQTLTASVGARPDSLEALLGQLAAVTERI